MPKGIYLHLPRTTAVREQISQTMKRKGLKPTVRCLNPPHPKGRIVSQELRDRIAETLRGRKRPEMTGEKNPNWKGGRAILDFPRRCPQYKTWRKAVLDRDNWTCRQCGFKGNKWPEIQAHHVLRFSIYKESRYDVNCGLTLCQTCHKKIHAKVKK